MQIEYGKLAVAALLLLSVLSVAAVQTSAQSQTAVTFDSFEDGDLAEWTGDTQNFSVETGTSPAATDGNSKLYVPGQTASISRDIPADSYGELAFASKPENAGADIRINWKQDGTNVIRLRTEDSTVVKYWDGSSWQGADVYDTGWQRIVITKIDYEAGTFGLQMLDASGNVIDSSSGNEFANPGTSFDEVQVESAGYNDGYADNFRGDTARDLFVYDENTAETVTGANITARFYGEDTIVERSDDNGDGVISMSGIPPEQSLVVDVNADGYESRRVIIDSLIEQQSVYLLNESESSVENEFVLSDNTGRFSTENTQLYIKAGIDSNDDGTLEYKTIAGDYFGAGGRFPATLEQGERYRLLIRNDRGDERVLGSYTANSPGVVELTVGSLQFFFGEDTENATYSVNANITGSDEIKFNYSDPSGATSELDVTIHERTNESNVLFTDTANDLGQYGATVDIPQNSTASWVVDYEVTRNGETYRGSIPLGTGKYIPGVPLDDHWKNVFSVAALLVMGGLFSRTNVAAGAITIPAAAGVLWFADWLPGEISALFILVALGYGVMTAFSESEPIGA
ncbi:hypothetical protein [Halomarina rubra]|uniref:Uncharacterized protein n=1 Tax=Halomarina rubra TaxID=2071873 RepID=A0ABD6B0V2_9EURY|nr:hypothetical protein [Halomarina rubra]